MVKILKAVMKAMKGEKKLTTQQKLLLSHRNEL